MASHLLTCVHDPELLLRGEKKPYEARSQEVAVSRELGSRSYRGS